MILRDCVVVFADGRELHRAAITTFGESPNARVAVRHPDLELRKWLPDAYFSEATITAEGGDYHIKGLAIAEDDTTTEVELVATPGPRGCKGCPS